MRAEMCIMIAWGCGGFMKILNDYARRAGEEFVAASRSSDSRERAAHRSLALKYVALRDERASQLRRGKI
jgi:hypothetical protein